MSISMSMSSTVSSTGEFLPLLIAGSTASGKSALALALAKQINGRIINADSLQVYDTLRQLTARPSAQEEAQAPHALYGHVAAGAPYSVGVWQEQALAQIQQAQAAGQVPIVVGGTGLYFKSLTDGLVDLPEIPSDVREHWRRRLEAIGLAELYAELHQRDPPLAERLQPTDKQRILRGLEVWAATGTRLSDWQKIKPQAPLTQAHRILLLPDRDWLYARCNLRFEQMMQGAALEEVEALAALHLPLETTIRKALGVSQILDFVQGNLTREQAIEQAQQATRRYAKRQMTWFRNQMTGWESFSEQDYTDNYDKIFSFISQNSLTTT